MDRKDLRHLTKKQLVELALQLQRPDKTSRTSSKPPSTNRKQRRRNARPGGAKPGHEPHNRRLADVPDEVRDHLPGACDRCGGAFASDAALALIGAHDEIEIPPVRQAVWISDRYSAQQKHGDRHQTCLAHLARDTAFALEHGSDDPPLRFKLWLGRAFALAKTIVGVAASTLANKKRGLEKHLEALLCAPTGCDLARKLQAKIGRARDQLLTFCDYPGEVDVTNNTSERKLRPCVIQRKVINGYRAMWAAEAEAEADVRTAVDTARLNGANPFATIIGILARLRRKPPKPAAAETGGG